MRVATGRRLAGGHRARGVQSTGRMRLPPMYALLLCACMGSPDPAPWCSLEPRPAPEMTTPTPTWYGEAEAIVSRKCGGCHGPGGLGPFELRTYDDVAIRKEAIRAVVADRSMPPW